MRWTLAPQPAALRPVCTRLTCKQRRSADSIRSAVSCLPPELFSSSGLLSLVDRRLLYPGERVYRPTKHLSFYAILIGLLLILGGVEANPGPSVAANNSNDIMRLGVLNVRSAANKTSLIHDIIGDRNLDVLVLTETWFTENTPSAVTADVAPDGYSAAHRCRQNGMGGGVSVVYRHPHIQVAAVEMKTYCIAMFRLVASAASNPPLGADSHTPDVGGRFGSLATGLWK